MQCSCYSCDADSMLYVAHSYKNYVLCWQLENFKLEQYMIIKNQKKKKKSHISNTVTINSQNKDFITRSNFTQNCSWAMCVICKNTRSISPTTKGKFAPCAHLF